MGQGTVGEPVGISQGTSQKQAHHGATQLAARAASPQAPTSAMPRVETAAMEEQAYVEQKTVSNLSSQVQAASATPAEGTLSDTTATTAASLDSALEYNSMVLMSKLEQYVIKLSEKSAQASMALALDHLVELTNHIVEFAEQYSPSGHALTLEALLAKDRPNYGFLQGKHIYEKRVELHNDPACTQEVLNQSVTFQGFSNDLLRVINIYLSLNVKAFSTPRMAEQWKTLYKGFYKHLMNAVRHIQASQSS